MVEHTNSEIADRIAARAQMSVLQDNITRIATEDFNWMLQQIRHPPSIRNDALQDLAYVHGAQAYAVIAAQSQEAADEWLLGGCANRQSDAIRALTQGKPD